MGNLLSSNMIREPQFAGKFYTKNKNSLKEELDSLYFSAQPLMDKEKNPRALISPHAGYIFSGEVSASAFNQIPENNSYKRVFILASSHQYIFHGASIYTQGDYKTPIGEIKVDRKLGSMLVKKHEIFNDDPDAHMNEHSLEVQLPFLQYKLGKKFMIVPIIIGTQSEKDCHQIAETLKPYFNQENLFVISSDFSHYPEYKDAIKVDNNTAEAIQSNNPEFFLKTIKENKQKNIQNLSTSICGWTSVLTLMYLTENKNYEYKKIHYKNSGDIALFGDKNKVVGYHSIAVFLKENNTFNLTLSEQKYLLELARNTLEIHYRIKNKSRIIQTPDEKNLNQKAGVFVSLYYKNKLRGCIGTLSASETIIDNVKKMVISASKDRRFENLNTDEIAELDIEISLLSPLKKIYSIDEIIPGKHGIYIEQGLNSGTYLPQVATKTGWNTEKLLSHCSQDKAGLGWEGWKTANIFTYETLVFKE